MNFEERKEDLINHLIDVGALKTDTVIEAFRKIPRHLFVRKEYLDQAYADYPLHTMRGQTISQPYTVGAMIEVLQPKKGNRILDVGSGSGWTTALLGFIVGKKGKVVGIDIYPDLVDFAKKNVRKVGLTNVKLMCGDGKKGFSQGAPYDGVLINAACRDIPKPLVEQTKVSGRIVAPIGPERNQDLIVATKLKKGELEKKYLGPYVFVPLV